MRFFTRWRSSRSTAPRRKSSVRLHVENLEGRALLSAMFFSANDGIHGTELWTSNGSAAGTNMLKDANPGSSGSYPQNLINFNGTLIYMGFQAGSGYELFRSDGTAAGTAMLKDINPSYYSSSPNKFTVSGSTLFFVANDGTHGTE